MFDPQPTQPTEGSGQALLEIENLVAEIAELSRSDLPFEDFSRELLERTIRMLAATGGAVWVADSADNVQLRYQINFESLRASNGGSLEQLHGQLLKSVLDSGEAKIVPPRAGAGRGDGPENPSDFLLILCPLKVEHDAIGVVELIQRPTMNAAMQRGNLRLVSMVTDLAADFLRRRQLLELRETEGEWQQFEQFVRQVHASLDLRSTAFQVVNEGRRFVGCDRVSLAARKRNKLRLLAISGVDSPDPRSNVVRGLERLAAAVATSGEILWYQGDTVGLPPQLESPLGDYLDQSHARSVAVVPLLNAGEKTTESSAVIGVLAFESFDVPTDASVGGRITTVANHGTLALRNVLEYQGVPLLAVLRPLRRFTKVTHPDQWPKLALASLAGLVVLLALVFVPADFDVDARGTLQPEQRRDVYAPLDGEIIELRGQHDENVDAGQILLVMQSRQIDLEFQRLQGEHDTTQQRLLAVESARLQTDPTDDFTDSRSKLLAAEEQELKQLLASQVKQLAVLRQQREELEVRSPIGGRVLTWNLRQLLEDRPVQRGQALMRVANVEGPWVAELEVPDHRIGPVLAAVEDLDLPLEVTFALETNRGIKHQARVWQIAGRTEVGEAGPPTVRVTAKVNRKEISPLRPGATIYARIHCGRKPIGYVWFHDVFEAMGEWLFF